MDPDPDVVAQLMMIGGGQWSDNGCKRAAVETKNNVEQAVEWCFSHSQDANFNEPLPVSGEGPAAVAATAAVEADPEVVENLLAMGGGMWSVEGCTRSAVAAENSLERAIEWCMSHSQDADFNDPLPTPPTSGEATVTGEANSEPEPEPEPETEADSGRTVVAPLSAGEQMHELPLFDGSAGSPLLIARAASFAWTGGGAVLHVIAVQQRPPSPTICFTPLPPVTCAAAGSGKRVLEEIVHYASNRPDAAPLLAGTGSASEDESSMLPSEAPALALVQLGAQYSDSRWINSACDMRPVHCVTLEGDVAGAGRGGGIGPCMVLLDSRGQLHCIDISPPTSAPTAMMTGHRRHLPAYHSVEYSLWPPGVDVGQWKDIPSHELLAVASFAATEPPPAPTSPRGASESSNTLFGFSPEAASAGIIEPDDRIPLGPDGKPLTGITLKKMWRKADWESSGTKGGRGGRRTRSPAKASASNADSLMPSSSSSSWRSDGGASFGSFEVGVAVAVPPSLTVIFEDRSQKSADDEQLLQNRLLSHHRNVFHVASTGEQMDKLFEEFPGTFHIIYFLNPPSVLNYVSFIVSRCSGAVAPADCH